MSSESSPEIIQWLVDTRKLWPEVAETKQLETFPSSVCVFPTLHASTHAMNQIPTALHCSFTWLAHVREEMDRNGDAEIFFINLNLFCL